MKQMNETQSDIDAKSTRTKHFSIAAACLSILVSSTAMGQSLPGDENDSIVRAMYGFIYDGNVTARQQDENGIVDLSRSNYGTAENTRNSNEADYGNFLSNPMYLNNYFKSPSFSATRKNAQLNQP